MFQSSDRCGLFITVYLFSRLNARGFPQKKGLNSGLKISLEALHNQMINKFEYILQ